MIPKEQASLKFFYHVFPKSEKNLDPGREDKKFNIVPTNNVKFIPYSYNSNKENCIVQIRLPDYEFRLLRFGQSNNTKEWSANWVLDLQK